MNSLLKRLPLLFALASAPAFAAWPDDRPIEMIVGFVPGGATDSMARTLARFVEKRLGANAKIIVVNKPGSGGEMAVAQLANAKSDGYTIGMINAPGFMFLPMYRKAAYQPSQIRLISRLVDDPALMLTKRGGSVPSSLPALLQAFKKSSTPISVGHAGEGTTGHLAMLQLEKATGARINSIPYKGGAEAKLALMGGHIDYVMVTMSEAAELEQAGSTLVAVAQWSRARGPSGIPTASESGHPMLIASERGIGGPKALPEEIAIRLQAAIGEVLNDPAFIEAAKGNATTLAFLPGDEWGRSLNECRSTLQELVPLMTSTR
jgi:tripartite-type tricarboxylate transporter receptor subunit TctC